mgnify:CR=1 FL=1
MYCFVANTLNLKSSTELNNPRTRIVLSETILKGTIVTLRSNRNLMFAKIHQEVILYLPDISVQLVIIGVCLGSESCISIVATIQDIHLREVTAIHIAIITQTGITDLQIVRHTVINGRIQVGHPNIEVIIRPVERRRERNSERIRSTSVIRRTRSRRVIRIKRFQIIIF